MEATLQHCPSAHNSFRPLLSCIHSFVTPTTSPWPTNLGQALWNWVVWPGGLPSARSTDNSQLRVTSTSSVVLNSSRSTETRQNPESKQRRVGIRMLMKIQLICKRGPINMQMRGTPWWAPLRHRETGGVQMLLLLLLLISVVGLISLLRGTN